MCLGIPGQVIEMLEGYGGQLALVDCPAPDARSTSGCWNLISNTSLLVTGCSSTWASRGRIDEAEARRRSPAWS